MKTKKIILGICTIIALVFTQACKKDEGPGGKAHIHGHVEYNEDHVENAFVSIWYGASSNSESAYDDQIVTNSEGEFEFEDLNKGDYYLYSTWIDTADVKRKGATSVRKTFGGTRAQIRVLLFSRLEIRLKTTLG